MHMKLNSLNTNQLLIPIALLLGLIVLGRTAYNYWDDKVGFLDQEIELRTMQLDQYNRIVGNSKNYETANRSLQELQADIQKQRLFSAGTEALAQARFQNLVKDLAQKNQIDIRSTKIIPARRQENFSLLHLRIDAKAEIGAISNFLLDLRTEDHYIFVSDLEIKIINSREERYYYMTAELATIQDF